MQKRGVHAFAVVSIVIGLILGFAVFYFMIGKPAVAVIEIKGSIGSNDVDRIVELVEEIKNTKKIKAVVLDINSQGGEASDIEEIYLSMLELKESKPIVSSIDRLAASGAYYIAAVSNHIFAKPSSDVGNIGVIAVFPSRENVKENTIVTGPFKKGGREEKSFASEVEVIKEIFVNQVMLQRGSKLKITKQELTKARLYQGFDAIELGLVDEIGSRSNAIEKAAEIAGLRKYDVVIPLKDEEKKPMIRWLSINETLMQSSNTVPMYYYMYVPQ